MAKKINDGLTATQRYALRHPERRKESSRKYAEAHPEKRKQAYKKYYDANDEQRRADRREYYVENHEATYFSYMRRTYGLSPEQYKTMMSDQNAKCAICGVAFAEFSRRPAIDHDHATGKVRALLCGPCNVKVGIVETEGAWRSSVLSYIAKYKEVS